MDVHTSLKLLIVLKWVTGQHSIDPCVNYTEISDTTRFTSYMKAENEQPTCDKFHLKWYRFTATSPGVLATKCPSDNTRCGANVQIWTNGTLPRKNDSEVDITMCGKINSDCCALKNTLAVKNCETFFVYRLLPSIPAICMRYCLKDSVESTSISTIGSTMKLMKLSSRASIVYSSISTTDKDMTTETNTFIPSTVNKTLFTADNGTTRTSHSKAIYIGAGIGGAVFILFITGIIYFQYRRSLRRDQDDITPTKIELDSRHGSTASMAVRHALFWPALCLLIRSALTSDDCSMSPMDINFLIDTSDDTSADLFDQEKIFTSNLVNSMWDGKNRFGLFTFGTKIFSQFHLDTYSSVTEVQDAMQYIWKATGKADVASALQYTIKYSFLGSNGGRVVAPDIVFLLTSSDIRNETLIREIQAGLHSSNIELNVVIVGNYVSTYWYEKLTNVGRILRITDATSLSSIADSTKKSLCKGRGILRPWTEWSVCGSTCGYGLQHRHRTCEKKQPDDDDCDGDLLDDRECKLSPCLDPVDGVWSKWGRWADCSKTCGDGSQSRIRTCSNPFPENGGKQCPGISTQNQQCPDWPCPDCKRRCPDGSHLDKDCGVCVCSNVILHGNVWGEHGYPVKDAGVYLNSRQYKPLANTDVSGFFSVSDICMLDETVTVKHPGYLTKSLNPMVVNNTHWFINVTLAQKVAPVFTINPEDKNRLVGQSVTLCCKAIGNPDPVNYTWFKGTDILTTHTNTNGTLTFNSLRTTDAGKYQCLTETRAGSTRSSQAILTVSDNQVDTCTAPEPLLEELPVGCYVKNDTSKNSTIDVRTCGKGSCVSRDLQDNNTCSEWWPFHCCDTAERELVDIICDGFSYQTTRIKSCKCQMCFITTTVTGKAFGRYENGTEIPLRLGTVYANGQKKARTNMNGVFSFDVPRKLTKLVLQFSDTVFKKFLFVTKIVYIIPGSSTAVRLALPLKPAPQPFHTSSDLDVEVGGSTQFQASGRISIPKDSMVTSDGKTYTGPAKAGIHYMDPRNLNDFEAANGQFVTHDDGEMISLETFGVFTTSFEDDNGKPLFCNSPMSFLFDPTVLNISTNVDGQPDIDLWSFDENSGSWVFTEHMKYQTSKRQRRQYPMVIGTETITTPIQRINLFEPTFQTKIETYYVNVPIKNYNGDIIVGYSREPRNRTIIQTLPDKSKPNACYLSVVVYKTFSGKESVGPGIQVTAVTKKGNSYKGYDKKPTNSNGHVCLSIFCDSKVYLSAENNVDASPLRAFPKHDLPPGYEFKNIRNATQVELMSRNTLEVMTASGQRFSPVYYADDDVGSDLQRCKNKYKEDFKFQFALSITKSPKHAFTQPENEYDNKLSWYPTPPDYITRKVCFLKALIKIRENYGLRFLATSYQSSKSGGQYGTYNAGPLPEPTFTDMINRAVCLEVRCPGMVNDKGSVTTNVATFVDVRMNPANSTCRFRKLVQDLSVTELFGGKGFQVTLQPDKSYGPRYGVYMATDSRTTVERFCAQGRDTGTIDMGMNPTLNAAVEYDCT